MTTKKRQPQIVAIKEIILKASLKQTDLEDLKALIESEIEKMIPPTKEFIPMVADLQYWHDQLQRSPKNSFCVIYSRKYPDGIVDIVRNPHAL